MTLTKRNLVTRISGKIGLTQQQVFDVVQKTLDYIAEALSKGDKVELRNFGDVVQRLLHPSKTCLWVRPVSR